MKRLRDQGDMEDADVCYFADENASPFNLAIQITLTAYIEVQATTQDTLSSLFEKLKNVWPVQNEAPSVSTATLLYGMDMAGFSKGEELCPTKSMAGNGIAGPCTLVLQARHGERVFVNLSGQVRTTNAKLHDLVDRFREQVSVVFGIQGASIGLEFSGTQLSNGFPLSYYRVQPDSTINVTVDTLSRHLIAISPPADAIDVPLDPIINVKFDIPISDLDPARLFQIQNTRTLQTCAYSAVYDVRQHTVTCVPKEILDPNSQYKISLRPSMVFGVDVNAKDCWCFMTGNVKILKVMLFRSDYPQQGNVVVLSLQRGVFKNLMKHVAAMELSSSGMCGTCEINLRPLGVVIECDRDVFQLRDGDVLEYEIV